MSKKNPIKDYKSEYQFVLTVQSNDSRKSAETAVLAAFALRQPDGCSFELSASLGDLGDWANGFISGVESALNAKAKARGLRP